jgi:hypothetical protein
MPTSKYIGVDWKKEAKKWRAKIKYDNKIQHIGYFDDEKEASDAYQKRLKELKTAGLR